MADNISDISDGLGRIVLDHPPLNILTRSALAELRASLAGLAEEPELRAVLLTATGKHFSAGADVGEHLPPGYLELIPEFLDTVADLAEFPVPVVAAVRGRCGRQSPNGFIAVIEFQFLRSVRDAVRIETGSHSAIRA